MAREMEGRVRYDKETDSFIYEIRTVDIDEEGEEEIGEWGMCLATKCRRREGAEEGEEADFIHYSFMKQIVADVWNFDMRVHLA